MQSHERHLSDQELALAADGELQNRKAGLHLDACAQCRVRLAEFEAMIAELATAQRNDLNSDLPSIARPRAMLRTRLAEQASEELGVSSRLWIPANFWASAFGVAALVAVVAVAGLPFLRHFAAPRENFSLRASDHNVLPNRGFTPGAARTVSLHELCALPHEEVVKDVSPQERQKVLDEYGIPSAQSTEYEVDYLITPGLGGDDDIRNLWPEPYHSATWNAHLKDALEERLHEMVCSDQLDLSVAQTAIASNWIAAYEKYVAARPSKLQGDKEL